MKISNLRIVWMEVKNLSLQDLLSCPLTTTQDAQRLRTVEIPITIKFFITHNLHTQPLQCHYAVSKANINTITTNTTVESPHFPIHLQIKDNYFKVQLENDLCLHVSYHEFKTMAQSLEQLQQNKTQHFEQDHSLLDTYPIVQHTDVTLNTNKIEPFTQSNQAANYTWS